MVPWKYLSNFWKSLEMLLINCEINLVLTWSANCVISNATANQATTFAITDTKLYVPIVTLSIDDNVKLSQQWKLVFKSTISWNQYETTIQNARVNNCYREKELLLQRTISIFFKKTIYIQKKRKNAIAIFFQLFSQLIYLSKLRKFIERIPSAKIFFSKV